MKLSLVVATAGKWQGKVIPITENQFLIGRDPECQLRPTSAMISKRHCAISVRNDRAYVRDFDSTNGTFVNEDRVEGERELVHDDQLTIGPLQFQVQLESRPSISKPTPLPPTKAPARSEDEEAAAAMLLALQDEVGDSASGVNVDSQGIPTGSTVMETMGSMAEKAAENVPEEKLSKAAEREKAAKAASADTSIAAKAILDKYIRRPRT
jgi:pSer/pThr/pTyr-binding forkhead associated (FHA) protein